MKASLIEGRVVFQCTLGDSDLNRGICVGAILMDNYTADKPDVDDSVCERSITYNYIHIHISVITLIKIMNKNTADYGRCAVRVRRRRPRTHPAIRSNCWCAHNTFVDIRACYVCRCACWCVGSRVNVRVCKRERARGLASVRVRARVLSKGYPII